MQYQNNFGVYWYEEFIQVKYKWDEIKSIESSVKVTSNFIDLIVWWWLFETSWLSLSKL